MSLYIVIEGIDGTGKDTQADMLAERLRQFGLGVLRLNEPDDTFETGQFLRHCLKDGIEPEAHANLFVANRMTLLKRRVIPALEAGLVVVSCRSWLSTLVYQQDNWPLDWLIRLHQVLPAKATHLFVLDLPAELGMERRAKRPGHTEYYEKLETQKRNRDRYEVLFDPQTRPAGFDDCLAPHAKCRWIDARGTQMFVHDLIWEHVYPDTGLHKQGV